MNSLLFPGQGSQVVGMGSEFFNNFAVVKKIFEQANDKLGLSLSKIILEGPEDKLQLTQNTQPAIMTVSYSIFQVLKNEFGFSFDDFKYFAGHSLGEYSALVCAGALSFDDALFLLKERGKAMQEAVPLNKGSMIAVLGAKIDEINELLISIKEKFKVCEIANDNAQGQVILSGDVESVNLFQELLKSKKIKFIPLKVSAPFHCSLMRPAAEKMNEKINGIKFEKPFIEIISNVTSEPENDPDKIKNLLVEQIYTTVRWRESIINTFNNGTLNYIELGPGKVLCGMVKRTVKNVNCFSINTIADMENIRDEFKK
tara:strand:- start:32 stop:973 length:942 start_codon:yes stop_codon:yes gene_type:complete